MAVLLTPMRWPGAWNDPSALDLLGGTAIDCLLVDDSDEFVGVRERAEQMGLRVMHPDTPAEGIAVLKGVWPGVKMGRGGGQVEAGPTGVPWVDSNGWSISLARALRPEIEVWVDAPPEKGAFVTADSYGIAFADSAAYGGRWIIALDTALAAALAAGKPEAQTPWQRIIQTAGFFAAHKPWAGYAPVGAAGVISDFAGPNEFFSGEVLNLLARAGLHYRILPKQKQWNTEGLRALLYVDSDAPAPAVRKRIDDFVNAGGMLISPFWPKVLAGARPLSPLDKYSVSSAGKGKIVTSKTAVDDPYVFANDAVVLVSHRYDLVRFWNSGATASFYTAAPDRRSALVHLLFYSDRGPDSASVRIAGRYGAVRAATVESPRVAGVQMVRKGDAVEVHLPQVSQYVALELDQAETHGG
jgi:hypothetical protein